MKIFGGRDIFRGNISKWLCVPDWMVACMSEAFLLINESILILAQESRQNFSVSIRNARLEGHRERRIPSGGFSLENFVLTRKRNLEIRFTIFPLIPTLARRRVAQFLPFHRDSKKKLHKKIAGINLCTLQENSIFIWHFDKLFAQCLCLAAR